MDNKCLSCGREHDDKRYAFIYCSEECWCNDGCPSMGSVLELRLLMTFTKFGIVK